MIETIKQYTSLIVLTMVLSMLAFTHYKAYQSGQGDVQVKFDAYRSRINDQLQAAINEKKRIEAEQNEKLAKATLDYSDSQRRLRDALKRLQDSAIVLRSDPLQVSGCCGSIVSRASKDTERTANTTEITTGIRQTSFYSDAMMDTLQCSQLIKFVQPK